MVLNFPDLFLSHVIKIQLLSEFGCQLPMHQVFFTLYNYRWVLIIFLSSWDQHHVFSFLTAHLPAAVCWPLCNIDVSCVDLSFLRTLTLRTLFLFITRGHRNAPLKYVLNMFSDSIYSVFRSLKILPQNSLKRKLKHTLSISLLLKFFQYFSS